MNFTPADEPREIRRQLALDDLPHSRCAAAFIALRASLPGSEFIHYGEPSQSMLDLEACGFFSIGPQEVVVTDFAVDGVDAERTTYPTLCRRIRDLRPIPKWRRHVEQ